MKPIGRILVVGGDGLIGHAVAGRLRRDGHDVVATSRRSVPALPSLDLARDASSWPIPHGIGLAYICAAITSIEACTIRRDEAWAVNVEGTTAIAQRLVEAGSRVVFLSSNMVFDGSTPFTPAGAETCPRTDYGRMKVEAERRLLALGDAVWVVRLTKVFGPNPPLVSRWRRSLTAGEPVHPFADMVLAPLSAAFAADVLARLAGSGGHGILQVSATADIGYVEVATRLAQLVGAPRELVQPLGSGTVGGAPLHTTLDAARLREQFGLHAPSPWDAIEHAFGAAPPAD